MKTCPECARNYGDDAVVCAYDGFALSSGATSSWSADRSGSPQEGDVLGVYRILGKLAEGGMGEIFRAEHVRLGRQVALKVLKPELASRTEVVNRFFEEARAVNEIGHDNIVDIIDFVEVSDQSPPLVYMVMELLVGEDLAHRIRSAGPLDPPEVVEIAAQVTEALIAVHRVKILHRDLKPENIYLVRSEDGPPRVKLLDFGVAKAFGERQRVNLTDPGTAVGTPEYMAPEQILGKELDERTDIYALGLVIYDMLTNSVPFQSSKYGELLVAQVKELPEPPSARRAGNRSCAPLPEAMEQAVMRCLQKKPQDRFQNVRELKEALLRSVGAEVDSLGRVSTMSVDLDGPYTTSKITSKIRWLPIGLGLGALLIGFAAVRLLLGDGEAGRPDAGRVGAVASASTPDSQPAPAVDAALLARGPDLGHPDAAPVTVVAAPTHSRKPRSTPPKKATGSQHTKPQGRKKPRRSGIEGTLDPFAQ